MPKNELRPNKGNSLIAFPTSFTVIDVETTGYFPSYDHIIEISAIRFRDSHLESTFTSLVNPSPNYGNYSLDPYITELTGITDEMLASAPGISSVLPDFFDYIGDDILLGHNANYDINFLYDNSERVLSIPLTNDFVDTMRISRHLHPEFSHHRLSDVCDRYSVVNEHAHRSLSDCHATSQCFFALQKEILETYGSFDPFIESFKKKRKSYNHKPSVRAADIVASSENIDPDNPLYGKCFVFTGVLEKMTRKEAMQIVVNHGGINGDTVTKKTNFLVLGNNDYCTTIKDGKSSKQKKAESYKLSGQDIEIIPENVFYDMLEDEY